MSRPIPVIPGFYSLIRRVHRSVFRLKPTKEVTKLIRYLVALASERYNVKVIAIKVLSTHWHAVVHDPEGRHPEFMQYVNSLIARKLNAHHETEDRFWTTLSNRAVHILDAETLVRQILYVMGNSVTHYLTDTAREWPGLKTLPEDLVTLSEPIDRPNVFFGEKSRMPQAVRLRLYLPDMAGLSAIIGERVTANSFRSYMEKLLLDLEKETRQKRKELKIPLVGQKAILAASPFFFIKTKKFRVQGRSLDGRASKIAPRFATRNPSLMKKAIKWLAQFTMEHYQAMQDWKENIINQKPSPTFPFGAYKYKKLLGVECFEAPIDFPIPVYSG